MSNNLIADRGATLIAGLIKYAPKLQILNLHYNHITARGGIALAKILKKNKKIKILDLSQNSITSGSGSLTVQDREIKKVNKKKKPLYDLDAAYRFAMKNALAKMDTMEK